MLPKACGALPAALTLLLLCLGAKAQSDTDILKFALQLECLEGEFYNYAAGSGGLSATDRGGGPTPIGGKAASLSNETLAFAKGIAANEKHHVEVLRSALGTDAIPCPQINLTAFAQAFDSAIAPSSFSPSFSPFVNDLSFLLATYLFEDVGASAYQGAAPLISNKTYLETAAAFFSVESYQAGAIRFFLYNLQQEPLQILDTTSPDLNNITKGLAALRAKLGGGSGTGVENTDGSPEVVPVNSMGETIPRTTSQIIGIVTGGGSGNKGLFFPNGLNGSIK